MSLRHMVPFRTGELPVDNLGLEIDSVESVGLALGPVSDGVTLSQCQCCHRKFAEYLAVVPAGVCLTKFGVTPLLFHSELSPVSVLSVASLSDSASHSITLSGVCDIIPIIYTRALILLSEIPLVPPPPHHDHEPMGHDYLWVIPR